MRYALLLVFLLLVTACRSGGATEFEPYAVYYSNTLPSSAFQKYKLLIFDSQYHPPLRPLSDRGIVLLGYISVGEVERTKYYFNEVKQEGAILEKNPNWQNSYFVDMNHKQWIGRIITDMVPDVLHQGFDGLFIDTLDNAAELERRDPKKYAGMKEAAIRLIKGIRLHYPQIKIMVNRGYDILPGVARDVDMVLGESVYTSYDFDKRKYQLASKEEYQAHVEVLKRAKKLNPRLGVYTLDYWDIKDKQGIASIYKEQRDNGFIPYVSDVLLKNLIEEPVN